MVRAYTLSLVKSFRYQRNSGGVKMTKKSLYLITFVLALIASSRAANTTAKEISFTTELRRMRSADHLYLPQDHKILQYSGFSRKGSNPDRFDYLYKEDIWLVYTDCQGPGVVTRIWSTHGEKWRDIKIELDGQIIYEGNAKDFFAMNTPPFAPPLCELRQFLDDRRTAEGEKTAAKQWGVSYVPMPFKKRFRYMQTDQLYNNINIKKLEPGAPVTPFVKTLTNPQLEQWNRTAQIWKRMDLYGPALEDYKKITKKLDLKTGSATLDAIEGPGIIRAIKLRCPAENLDNIFLDITWDTADKPSIHVPIGLGFGSAKQKTFAMGQGDDGRRFLYLPMPFRTAAKISLVSNTPASSKIELQVYYEPVKALPAEAMILNGYYNHGQFLKGKDKFRFPDVPQNEFLYHNGYTVLDTKGTGHIVAYMDLFDCQPELDEHIFFDDQRSFPENSWNGTGHEDLFDMAWGHKTQSTPMVSGGSQSMQEANVKLFWNNPMTFKKAIRFNWEWAFMTGIEPPRDAKFKSVVYWYTPYETSTKNNSVTAPGAAVKKLAGGFQFTEGPAADSKGNIFFTDIPNNRIHKFSTDGKLSTFLENSGGANGLFFDRRGNLIACAGGARRLVSIDPDGNITILADKYKGKKLNSPNDLWITKTGGIYFSDPRYGSRDNLEQPGEHVYYLSPDRKTLKRVIDDMTRPNGLIGTPDGKTLYVADAGANQTFAYKINPDGSLTNKKLFAPQGSDGMTIDTDGNIYLTRQEVTVYDKSGRKIQTIDIPERPSNLCFGSKDKKTLFITARTSLYSVRTQTKGL